MAGEKQIINQRVTPITEATRKVLLRVIRERPGLGNGPLFPAPRDARMPVEGDTLRSWIRRVEKAAGVPRLPHDSFHGLRRKWATERKHLPDVDVAAAGGWASINTMAPTSKPMTLECWRSWRARDAYWNEERVD